MLGRPPAETAAPLSRPQPLARRLPGSAYSREGEASLLHLKPQAPQRQHEAGDLPIALSSWCNCSSVFLMHSSSSLMHSARDLRASSLMAQARRFV
jgi:hypothetical protein